MADSAMTNHGIIYGFSFAFFLLRGGQGPLNER